MRTRWTTMAVSEENDTATKSLVVFCSSREKNQLILSCRLTVLIHGASRGVLLSPPHSNEAIKVFFLSTILLSRNLKLEILETCLVAFWRKNKTWIRSGFVDSAVSKFRPRTKAIPHQRNCRGQILLLCMAQARLASLQAHTVTGAEARSQRQLGKSATIP